MIGRAMSSTHPPSASSNVVFRMQLSGSASGMLFILAAAKRRPRKAQGAALGYAFPNDPQPQRGAIGLSHHPHFLRWQSTSVLSQLKFGVTAQLLGPKGRQEVAPAVRPGKNARTR